MNFNGQNSSVTETIVDSLNLATALAVMNFPRNDVSGFKQAILQLSWSGLTGTLNGSVKLQYSNDPSLGYIDITDLSEPLSSANGNAMLISDYIGRYLNIVVTKGSITAGVLKANLILKK